MVGISSTSKDLGLGERRNYIKHLKQSKLGKHRWRVGLGLVFSVNSWAPIKLELDAKDNYN